MSDGTWLMEIKLINIISISHIVMSEASIPTSHDEKGLFLGDKSLDLFTLDDQLILYRSSADWGSWA